MSRDVSISQVHILINLQEYGPTMVSDVATQLQISTPSASTILDRMEEHGLVERTRDECDRRVVRAAITDQGRVVLDEITGIKRANLARLLATMTAEEVEAVLHGAEALHCALSRRQEVPAQPSLVATAEETSDSRSLAESLPTDLRHHSFAGEHAS